MIRVDGSKLRSFSDQKLAYLLAMDFDRGDRVSEKILHDYCVDEDVPFFWYSASKDVCENNVYSFTDKKEITIDKGIPFIVVKGYSLFPLPCDAIDNFYFVNAPYRTKVNTLTISCVDLHRFSGIARVPDVDAFMNQYSQDLLEFTPGGIQDGIRVVDSGHCCNS